MDILHIKQQLELARTGNEQAKQVFVKTIFEALDYNRLRYLRLLQPEDKAWLLAENCCESLCIVLATMYIHKVREWEEIFTDEQTGEQVPITRTEELRETVFEQNEVEAKELFDKACKLNEGHCYFKSFIDCLEYTPFDTTSLLLEEIEREEKHNLASEELYKWACEKVADRYRWGGEECGIFIDKLKAKEYYEKAGITDENPLEDSYEGFEEPYIFVFTIKGGCAELKALIMEHAEQPVNDPHGIYSRVNGIINRLIDNDERRHEYKGNILHVDEDGGNIVVTAELPDAFPLRAAIQHRYPGLEIEVEEVFYED